MNLFRIVSILTLSTLVINTYGQYEHIEWKNSYEKKVLTTPEKQSSLELLLAISESDSLTIDIIKSKIGELKSELEKKKFTSKSEEKQVKLLFELTHKKFFLKYQEISNFDKIFDTKEYNCVSATALYSIILDEYNIPYVIKEKPTHVYTVAYPETKNILLESTAPQSGYYYPSNADIHKAVSSLMKLKYVTDEEVESKGERIIYNEFFFGDGEINLKKLAGLQYHNETVEFLADEKYEEALNANLKSQILYPRSKTDYMSYVLLATILNKSKFEDFKDIRYLARYGNLATVDKAEIISSYQVIINNRMFLQSDYQFTDSAYAYLQNNLLDSALKINISEIQFASYARFFAQKSDLIKSLEYSTQAFAINPKNVNTQALITQCLVQDLSRRTGSTTTIKKMDDYQVDFPFLIENSLFQSLYFFTYAHQAFNHLHADDIDKGIEYLGLLEELVFRFGAELRYDENQYGLVYAEAGAAYFRARRYSKAKDIIEKGLSILPDHPELKIRLEIVIDEID